MTVAGREHIVLQGKEFAAPHREREIRVLLGDNPPTITGGYGLWTVVQRPLFVGLTVPQGYDPAKLKVEVRFGIWDGRFGFKGWDTSDEAGGEVEAGCSDLHWMAGGNEVAGPSPIVYATVKRGNVPTDMIPSDYWNVAWVIDGGIEWGKSLRNPNGLRVFQDATFSLLAYLGIGLSPPKRTTSQKGGYFKVTRQLRTIYAIASAPSSRSIDPESVARRIRDAPQNNPCHGSNIHLFRKSLTTYKLPVGLDVWLPAHST